MSGRTFRCLDTASPYSASRAEGDLQLRIRWPTGVPRFQVDIAHASVCPETPTELLNVLPFSLHDLSQGLAHMRAGDAPDEGVWFQQSGHGASLGCRPALASHLALGRSILGIEYIPAQPPRKVM